MRSPGCSWIGFLVERRVLEQAEHDAAGLETTDAGRRDDHRRVVPGVAVGEASRRARACRRTIVRNRASIARRNRP